MFPVWWVFCKMNLKKWIIITIIIIVIIIVIVIIVIISIIAVFFLTGFFRSFRKIYV